MPSIIDRIKAQPLIVWECERCGRRFLDRPFGPHWHPWAYQYCNGHVHERKAASDEGEQ